LLLGIAPAKVERRINKFDVEAPRELIRTKSLNEIGKHEIEKNN